MILKPCPFCGSISMKVKCGKKRSRVACKCGATGPSVDNSGDWHIVEQAAAQLWNDREADKK